MSVDSKDSLDDILTLPVRREVLVSQWTIDQVRAAKPRTYEAPVFTMAPSQWRPSAPSIACQATYSLLMNELFPELSRILPIPGVYLAGGAAAAGITSHFSFGHADLFMVGVEKEHALTVADRIRDAVRDELAAPSEEQAAVSQLLATSVARSPVEELRRGCLVIPGARPGLAYHLMLEPVLNMEALLEKFDTDIEQIVYDGTTATMTASAAYAYVHRVNIVRPPKLTPHRLCKYFANGFAMAFPGLSERELTPGEHRLPMLELRISELHGRLAIGEVQPTQPDPELTTAPCENVEDALTLAGFKNVGAIARDDDLIYVAARINPARQLRVADLLPGDSFATMLGILLENVREQVLRAGPEVLHLERLASPLAIHISPDTTPEELLRALAPAALAAMRNWARRRGDIVDWWRGPPPGPCPSWEDWLGGTSSATDPTASLATDLATLRGLLSRGHPAGPVWSSECVICHGIVRTGTPGTLILNCGHQFHWGSADCPGFQAWARHNGTCPVCRR